MSDSPALIITLHCNGQPVPLVNCARYRVEACAVRCTKFGSVDLGRCSSCAMRTPIVRPDRAVWRGAGDAVRSLVRVLFLGRLDLAERLAARVEGLFARPQPKAPAPENPGARKPCGCKSRQQALNRAIPFRTNGH